jgi:hypothetical protein
MTVQPSGSALSDFILSLLDDGELRPEYWRDPVRVIKESDLDDRHKSVLLSRNYQLIRYALEAELNQDLSMAKVTITLAIPTITLWG